MKHLKKTMALLICVLAMGCMTACGNNGTTDNTTGNGTTENGVADDVNNKPDSTTNVNDATKGTDNDGVLEDAADDVRDGVEDTADDVRDAVDGNDADNNVRNNGTDVTR